MPDSFHRVDVFFQGYGNDAVVESLSPVSKSGFNPSQFQLIAKAVSRRAGIHSEIKTREERFEPDTEKLQSAGTKPVGRCRNPHPENAVTAPRTSRLATLTLSRPRTVAPYMLVDRANLTRFEFRYKFGHPPR